MVCFVLWPSRRESRRQRNCSKEAKIYKIEGLSKLKRKILAEVKFLKSVRMHVCIVKNGSVVKSILDFLTPYI